MKIAFISAANSFHTSKWANSVAEKGHEVTLFSLANHIAPKDTYHDNIKIIYLPKTGFKGYFLNASILKKYLKQTKFDVINAQYASGYGTLARLANASPLVLAVLGSDVFEFPTKSPIHKLLVQKNINFANKIISASHVMAKKTQELTQKNLDINVIPFGVNPQIFCKQPKTINGIRIGTVKLLEPVYDIAYLLKAFALLCKKLKQENNPIYNEIYLDIYGYGSSEQELKELASSLNIADRTTFYGYINNNAVPQAISNLDVFCLTSNMESFGVAAVEAMACEAPVVASACEGFKEVVDDNITGYIIDKSNINNFVNKIYELITDPQLRETLGKNGREKVLKYYQLSTNINEFEKLLKTCANGTKK